MQDIRWKAFWLGLCLIIVSLLVGAAKGSTTALVLFSAGLALYLFGHLYWLNKLQVWLKNPNPDNVPEGAGVWEGIFSALFQTHRKHLRSESELISSLEGFKTRNQRPARWHCDS